MNLLKENHYKKKNTLKMEKGKKKCKTKKNTKLISFLFNYKEREQNNQN